MPIRVLDAYVAGQIAAGEVVERPASIVKELVENAIDAQATEIRVEIREGGRREIRITDNGTGIPADEIEIAFQRHATSKLHTADDLFNIQTLGFRGEALPSIAAVAQVICTSRTAEAETGVELRLAAGEVQGRTPRGGTPGTSFVIKNLFYNAPVRLKFLRSDASESSLITNIVQHYSLAYPHIRWSLFVDGRLQHQTNGTGQLIDSIIELYGLDVARQMLPLDDQAGEGDMHTHITGYISQPALHRSARSSIHLFVNRRWVQARGQLAFVIEEAYHTLLMKGRHPMAVINIEVDPTAVDVNVHPTKSEVKFLYEPQVFSLIGRAVRSALSEHMQVQPLTLPGAAAGDHVARRIELRPATTRPTETAAPAEEWNSGPAAPPIPWPDPDDDDVPAQEQPSTPVAQPNWASEGRWSQPPSAPPSVRPASERLAVGNPAREVTPPPPLHRQMPLDHTPPEPGRRPLTGLPPLRVVGQVSETYIVAEAADGLYLIDQHAAHERVVYERLMNSAGTQALEQQNLLLPARPQLSPAVTTLLLGHAEDLAEWGFLIAADEPGLVVSSVPAGLLEAEVGPALLEMADHLASGQGSTPTDWREKILTTVACHSAIRAGQILAHEEMRQLLQQLERCEFPRTCPHGRPTALLLSQNQLERQFGRKG